MASQVGYEKPKKSIGEWHTIAYYTLNEMFYYNDDFSKCITFTIISIGKMNKHLGNELLDTMNLK